MDSFSVHRPRNVDWQRAAALLYGDWGTSKAYVIGAAFLAAAYASLPIILAVCALTGLVGYNYIVICKQFPDGGGVYSAARLQSRFVVVTIILMSLTHLTLAHLEPSHKGFAENWTKFVGVILALSGVEAIANLTGVMKLDPGASLDRPMVGKTARKAILTVAIEVVVGTAMLGWAMVSLPPDLKQLLLDGWD